MQKIYETDLEYFYNTFEARDEEYDDEEEPETEQPQNDDKYIEWDDAGFLAGLGGKQDGQHTSTGQEGNGLESLLMKAFAECCKKTHTTPTTLRIEEDVLEWYKRKWKRGYQTRMKAALRAVMEVEKARKA